MLDHISRDLLPEFLNKERSLRSWSYQTHITLQNIKKLWKLINTCSPHEFTDPGNSRIVFDRPCFALLCLRLDLHRTEFVHTESLVVKSHSLLLVDQRSRRCQLDENAHQKHDR